MTKICIIAGNYNEAFTWAASQDLPLDCWFYPHDVSDLKYKNNFHVIVVGTAGENVPPSYFEHVYQLAKRQGRIGRI